MVKYKKYFQKMLEDNGKTFNSFKKLQEKYALNPDSHQKELNEKGEKVLEIIREYENRLCTDTERGIYSKFSTKLAEKFQNEIRAHFPMVDRIGIIIDKPGFAIKKIKLS
jgi:sugar-specific transcriptional regulator TrmB